MSASERLLEVEVPSRSRGYAVRVGPGLLERCGTLVREACPEARLAALVSDANVAPLHAACVRASLGAAGLGTCEHVVPAGETSKSPERLVAVVEALLAAGITRRDVVIALGGGVVGDLAGLAAALCARGVAVVQCPTSLLAQVDASIGGKVAVDLPIGKNLLGAFHFPALVLVDPAVLATLPEREIACGLAEMLKHGLALSAAHFDSVVARAEAFAGRDAEAMAPLVADSIALKASVVARDPFERDAVAGRILLNLGHTIGHAIEHASFFAVRHGEAVGLGLRAAARVSAARGMAAPGLELRVTEALARLRLPTDLDAWLAGSRGEAVAGALGLDKKRVAAASGADASGIAIDFVALRDVGAPEVARLTPAEILGLLRLRGAGC